MLSFPAFSSENSSDDHRFWDGQLQTLTRDVACRACQDVPFAGAKPRVLWCLSRLLSEAKVDSLHSELQVSITH